jgi:hypothetical protein
MNCILQNEVLRGEIQKIETEIEKLSEDKVNFEKELSKVFSKTAKKQRGPSKYEKSGSSKVAEANGNKQYETRIKDIEKKISAKKKSKRRLKDEIRYFKKFDTV